MIDPPRLAGRGVRHVFLRDMVLAASIGIYAHERAAKQRVRINVDMGVAEEDRAGAGLSRAGVGRDDLGRVVDYEAVVRAVRQMVGAGHVMLVETLAERLAETCLLDERVEVVRVRVEKLDVFDDLAAVGWRSNGGGEVVHAGELTRNRVSHLPGCPHVAEGPVNKIQ